MKQNLQNGFPFAIIKVEGNEYSMGGETMSEKKKKIVTVEKEWCKGCGICVAFCPKSVLAIENGKVEIVNIEACIQCGQCELRCPDYAIYLRGN
jgi:2-oxoglutarate ferredoxin oxidoreductase subunit delta